MLQGFGPELKFINELTDRFAKRNKRLYMVGGAVRDYLLSQTNRDHPEQVFTPDDLDLTTDALPDEVEEILKGWSDAKWAVGKRFGTIGAEKAGFKFEITTHRAESYTNDSRKPVVKYSDSIEEDLSRRDFTINSMAFELIPSGSPVLIDPFGGLSDLMAGVLKTPLSPTESFSDDPLRMLRAARFVARFNLKPDGALVTAMGKLKSRLEIVSKERIRDEFDKLIVLPEVSSGLWLLVETGVIDEFIPEIPALKLEQDPIHRHKDVLSHTIAVTEKTSPDKILRLAALFHDIGKPATREIGPEGVSFYFHDVVGSRMTKARMKELKYPAEEIEKVSRLVYLHLRFHGFETGWTDRAVRRYVRDAGELLDELNELTLCDSTTRNENKARRLREKMNELVLRIAALKEKEELDAIRPDLDGIEVMEILGLRPGREVGEALDFLMELRMDEGPLGKVEASRRLLAWFSSKGN
ncbi:MAG: CCA tRNA nucleotidyltransferase [Acidimicrobiaceae bacterium]|nr:CCA tRNA nucleotidyltransferase [Acidimicrobiaceae bacterium]